MIFSSKKNDATASYPGVPDSLHSDSFDTAGLARRPADTAPYVTPYLGLRARLSQIWVNRWTVLLALVLVRVVLLIAQLNVNIGEAKTKALAACSNVEDIGSAMASMPHYLSVGVDDLAAAGIEKAVHGMVDVLDLMIQGVEGLILFFINFVTATYVCLLTAMVRGSLDVVGAVADEAMKEFNKVTESATSDIKSISGDLESGINKLVDGIQNSFLGSELPDIPKADFSKPIDNLNAFKLNPDDFEKGLQTLKDHVPTFDQAQNLTKEAISIPFNLVRKALNDSFGDYTFDRDVFPLAQKQELTFCSENDSLNKFFQELYELVAKARIIFIVVLTVLAILAIVPMAWLEIMRWRRQQKHARLITQNHFDPMDVIYIASRPLSASWGIKISSVFNGKRRILTRWFVAYATSTPAIFVLSLAIAGFFSCLCQYILLRAIQNEVPALTNEVGHFADEVVKTLQNVSAEWAADANGVVTDVNDDINKHVLDYVVNATDAVNKTLDTFLTEINDGLNTAFKGTPLLDPLKTIVHCVLGIKIESVEKGLTWVHNHAHVSLPLFDKDTFSLGAKDSITGDSKLTTFLSSPSSVTTDEVTGAVKHVTDWLHDNLIQEAFLSIGILLVYMIVVLMGMTRALAGMATPDRSRAEGGFRYTGDNHSTPSPRSLHVATDETDQGSFSRYDSNAVSPSRALNTEKLRTRQPSSRGANEPHGYFQSEKF